MPPDSDLCCCYGWWLVAQWPAAVSCFDLFATFLRCEHILLLSPLTLARNGRFSSVTEASYPAIYDGIQAISDGKIGWSKFLVKNHPGPLREHILIGLDPKNCLKFSKKVNFMIFKNLVKSTKAKMAISEILPFSGKIVIAAKRKGLKRSPICQNWGILIVSKGIWCLAPKKYILGGEMVT